METIRTSQIRGIIPSLARSQADQSPNIRVISGQNFDFTLSGPRSAFGTCLVSNAPYRTGSKTPKLFTVGNTSFLFDDNRVVQLNHNAVEICYEFQSLFNCPLPSCRSWSMAYVGDTYYFSRPDVGIIQFDQFTGEWSQWTLEDFKASQLHGPIFGISQSLNRLIILGKDTVSWSDIDAGKKLTPNIYSAAGFQSLSLIGYGEPLAVYGSDNGFFTFTTNGVMHSRPTDQSNPFNHSVVSTTKTAYNAESITQIDDDSVAYLTKTGIYLIGKLPNNQFQDQKLEQIMGDYWTNYILPCLPTDCQPTAALFYLPDEDKLFLSIKETKSKSYQLSFVYNFAYEQWSTFNHEHQTIGNVQLGRPTNTTIATGYIDNSGFVHEFNHHQNFREEPITRNHLPLDSFVELSQFRLPSNFIDSQQNINQVQIITYLPPKFGNLVACAPEVQNFSLSIADQNCNYKEIFPSRQVKNTIYFNLNNTGDFHTLLIEAKEPLTYFSIAQINLTAVTAGRK